VAACRRPGGGFERLALVRSHLNRSSTPTGAADMHSVAGDGAAGPTAEAVMTGPCNLTVAVVVRGAASSWQYAGARAQLLPVRRAPGADSDADVPADTVLAHLAATDRSCPGAPVAWELPLEMRRVEHSPPLDGYAVYAADVAHAYALTVQQRLGASDGDGGGGGSGGSASGARGEPDCAVLVYGRVEHRSHAWDPGALAGFPIYQPLQLGTLRLTSVGPASPAAAPAAAPRTFDVDARRRLPLCAGATPPGPPSLDYYWMKPRRRFAGDGRDAAEWGVLGPDQAGGYVMPATCRLKTYSAAEAHACLAARGTRAHFIGDSNVRRLAKSLIGHVAAAAGVSWCDDRRADRACVCEDWDEPDRWGGALTYFKLPPPAEGGGTGAARPGEGTPPADVWCTLTWLPEVYKRSWAPQLSVIQSRRGDPAEPVAVVFDTIHWDTAFGTFDEFRTSVPLFLRALVSAVGESAGNGSTIVFRAPNYYCCWADPTYWRLWTTARVQQFYQHAVRVFNEVVVPAFPRSFVLDTYRTSQARPLNATQRIVQACASGHEPSEDVDMQYQLLLNSLCNG
jgi:hypothetical protein